MPQRKKLLFAFFLAFIGFNFPVLSIFNKALDLRWNFPVLYVYLFSFWLLSILIIFLAMNFSKNNTSNK